MKVSVIIPFFNEEENVVNVVKEVLATNPDVEVVAVNDGSSDSTAELLGTVHGIHVVHLSRNLGQSAALYAGLRAASGEILVMMDGDGQNDPADIPALIESLRDADVVCGYRRTRNDSWDRKLASRIGNGARNLILHDGIRDTGCTLKAIRRDHVRFLVPFNGLHRYIPALLKAAKLSIKEIAVNHRPRLAGNSKYTIAGRAWKGIYDLIGVSWLIKRKIHWPYDIENI